MNTTTQPISKILRPLGIIIFNSANDAPERQCAALCPTVMFGTDELDNERVLRDHIHEITFAYATEHITTDFDQFTRDAVSELLAECLQMLPLFDRNVLRLPADPWDRLSDLYDLQKLQPYQERLQIATEVSQYLRTTIRTVTGLSMTARISQEHNVQDHFTSCYPSLLVPELSRKAQKATPNPGSGKFFSSIPSKYDYLPYALLPRYEDAKVSESEVLNLTWRLQAEDHQAIASLLKSAAALSRPTPTHYNSYRSLHTRPDTPPLHTREAELVPIFPRALRLRSGGQGPASILPDLQNMTDLSKKIPIPLELGDEPIDFAKENMLLVDGWQTLTQISSPPTLATPTSSQEDIDQLLEISSPNTSPTTIVGFPKMDVPPMPRYRRIKGASKRGNSSQSLVSFLWPHLVAQESSEARHLSPEPSTSMVGQPSTTMKKDELACEIMVICGPWNSDDARRVVMEEQLEKGERVLMQVPDLPPPTAHPPNALCLPESLADLVKARQSNDSLPSHGFLRKTKGLKALNLTLSWTPFTARERLPSNMQVTRSAHILDGDETFDGIPSHYIESQVDMLVDSLTPEHMPASNKARWGQMKESSQFDLPITFYDRQDFILSRRERIGAPPEDLVDEEHDENDGIKSIVSPIVLEVFNNLGAGFEDSGIFMDDDDKENEPPRPSKRTRMEVLQDRNAHFDYAVDRDPAYDSDFYHPQFLDDDRWPQDQDIIYEEDYDPAGDGTLDQYHNALPDSVDFDLFEPLPFVGPQPPPFVSQPQSTPTMGGQDAFIDPHILEPHSFDDAEVHSRSLATAGVCQDILEGLRAPDLADRALGITEFLRLRSRAVKPAESLLQSQPEAYHFQPTQSVVSPKAPAEIYNKNTLRLPQSHESLSALHQHLYLASVELLQKNLLLRALRSSECAVNLVERESLSGVDIILDPNTAVIFASLVSLPSQRDSLIDRVSEQSWRYRSLLVVFEAYPASTSFKDTTGNEGFNAYTPPTIKAIGRFRRDIDISAACKKKDVTCSVQFAFADSVREAALYARHFGDLAEQADSTLWGDRSWLDGEISPDEGSLAAVPRMNLFAAYVILCQVSVDDFLALSPQERLDAFASYIGDERMNSVNRFIEERVRAIESSEVDEAGSVAM